MNTAHSCSLSLARTLRRPVGRLLARRGALALAAAGLGGLLSAQSHITETQVLPAPGMPAGSELARSLDHANGWAVMASVSANANSAGVATVYRSQNGSWVFAQQLAPSDGQPFDYFGGSVAIDRDLMVIGAPQHDEGAPNAGAAYVFQLQGDSWVEIAKLVASTPSNGRSFGNAVAVDATSGTIAVGAVGDRAEGSRTGAVHVFRSTGPGQLTETGILRAPDARAGDALGQSLALDGWKLVAGAPTRDSRVGEDSGAVYVFYRNQHGSYGFHQRVEAPDATAGDRFGNALQVAGNSLLVGAPFAEDSRRFPAHHNTGRAYLFHDNEIQWVHEASLEAPAPREADWFGYSVDLDSSRALVGAYRADFGARNAGGAFTFFRARYREWPLETVLAASHAASDTHLGMGVSLSPHSALVGAPGHGACGTALAFPVLQALRLAVPSQVAKHAPIPCTVRTGKPHGRCIVLITALNGLAYGPLLVFDATFDADGRFTGQFPGVPVRIDVTFRAVAQDTLGNWQWDHPRTVQIR